MENPLSAKNEKRARLDCDLITCATPLRGEIISTRPIQRGQGMGCFLRLGILVCNLVCISAAALPGMTRLCTMPTHACLPQRAGMSSCTIDDVPLQSIGRAQPPGSRIPRLMGVPAVSDRPLCAASSAIVGMGAGRMPAALRTR
jgi:hypothetical protein